MGQNLFSYVPQNVICVKSVRYEHGFFFLRTDHQTQYFRWEMTGGERERGSLDEKWHCWWISFFSGGGKLGSKGEERSGVLLWQKCDQDREGKKTITLYTNTGLRIYYCPRAPQWDRCTVNHLQFLAIIFVIMAHHHFLSHPLMSFLIVYDWSEIDFCFLAAPASLSCELACSSMIIKSYRVVFCLCALDVYKFIALLCGLSTCRCGKPTLILFNLSLHKWHFLFVHVSRGDISKHSHTH